MRRAPDSEAEALRHLAEDLYEQKRFAAGGIVEAGLRALAGGIERELLECAPGELVTRTMVAAWARGLDGAVLAGYRSLYAPESDSDVVRALDAMHRAARPAPAGPTVVPPATERCADCRRPLTAVDAERCEWCARRPS